MLSHVYEMHTRAASSLVRFVTICFRPPYNNSERFPRCMYSYTAEEAQVTLSLAVASSKVLWLLCFVVLLAFLHYDYDYYYHHYHPYFCVIILLESRIEAHTQQRLAVLHQRDLPPQQLHYLWIVTHYGVLNNLLQVGHKVLDARLEGNNTNSNLHPPQQVRRRDKRSFRERVERERYISFWREYVCVCLCVCVCVCGR